MDAIGKGAFYRQKACLFHRISIIKLECQLKAEPFSKQCGAFGIVCLIVNRFIQKTLFCLGDRFHYDIAHIRPRRKESKFINHNIIPYFRDLYKKYPDFTRKKTVNFCIDSGFGLCYHLSCGSMCRQVSCHSIFIYEVGKYGNQ
ncbi:hypothetical protein IMSAG013_00267 [Clostridiales bacterium]|nr:hypothetical protein IMSAG013_00267 [Clostridiales bacterium]